MNTDTTTALQTAPAITSPTATETTIAHGSDRWYLSAAPIVRALVHLCVPMAAAMIVGAVYNVINAGFIGSLHDTALLAAITFGTAAARPGHGGRRRVRRRRRRAHLAAARRGRARAREGRRDQARLVVRRLGLGDRRRRVRRHRAAPPAPARRRCSARMPPPCPRRPPTSPSCSPSSPCSPRRSASSSSCGPRAPRARSMIGLIASTRREPGVRRAVHPGAALGRRRRGAVDRPVEPRDRRRLLRWSGCSGTAST